VGRETPDSGDQDLWREALSLSGGMSTPLDFVNVTAYDSPDRLAMDQSDQASIKGITSR